MTAGLHFAYPLALLLLLAVPLTILAMWKERFRAPRLRHPRLAALRRAGPGLLAKLSFIPNVLMLAALGLCAVALARPRERSDSSRDLNVQGIDIVIALDLSTSMRAADFKPNNRLHVAKEVLKEFISTRQNDRIGLVVFAGEAYTQSPLTLDYSILGGLVDSLRFGVIEDGTAIGNAIATSLNRLRESTAKSKVVILITDGDSNAGQVSPIESAKMAENLGIKVFTILVGKGGVVPYPAADVDAFGRSYYTNIEIPVNPGLLQEIAKITHANYYNATDRESLASGLSSILDTLEKSKLFDANVVARYSEMFPQFLAPAFWLALVSMLLLGTRFRIFP